MTKFEEVKQYVAEIMFGEAPVPICSPGQAMLQKITTFKKIAIFLKENIENESELNRIPIKKFIGVVELAEEEFAAEGIYLNQDIDSNEPHIVVILKEEKEFTVKGDYVTAYIAGHGTLNLKGAASAHAFGHCTVNAYDFSNVCSYNETVMLNGYDDSRLRSICENPQYELKSLASMFSKVTPTARFEPALKSKSGGMMPQRS